MEVVNLEWLTTSFLEGKPTTVTDHHRLKRTLQPDSVKDDSDTTSESHDHQVQALSLYVFLCEI